MDIQSMIRPVIRNTPPSGIRKYFSLINEMKDAISLGVGEPDFITPRGIMEAGIESLRAGATHYSPNSGYADLRREISVYMKRRFGLQYDPENQILVTVGGSEAIDLALRAVAGPGDEVILPEPSFVAYKACINFTGATPVIIDLQANDNFKLTPDALEKAITPKTKALILPFPNNPTGAIMSGEEIGKVADVIRDRDILVISDEVYAELTYEGKHVSIAGFPGMYDRTVVINGFSKAYAMTGWRLGYLCGHPELVNAMYKIHQYAIMCSPSMAQYAAIEALQNGDGEIALMTAEYDRRRRVVVEGFTAAGLQCFEPKGAFYVFPGIEQAGTGMNSEEFCDSLLEEEKVLVVPGTAFGECGEGFVRACYAASMENIEEAMRRVKKFVERKRK